MAAVNKKMVAMASKLADGILLYLRPIEELKKTTAELRAGHERVEALKLLARLYAQYQTRSQKKQENAQQ